MPDDVIKWKHFPRCWSFVRGIHRSPLNFPSQWPVTRSFDASLICARINSWINNRKVGDLRRHRAHHDVTVVTGYLRCSLNWTYIISIPRYVRSDRLHRGPPIRKAFQWHNFIIWIAKRKHTQKLLYSISFLPVTMMNFEKVLLIWIPYTLSTTRNDYWGSLSNKPGLVFSNVLNCFDSHGGISFANQTIIVLILIYFNTCFCLDLVTSQSLWRHKRAMYVSRQMYTCIHTLRYSMLTFTTMIMIVKYTTEKTSLIGY